VTRDGVRPGRPLSPIITAVAIAGTWWLVAHNSGEGWVQALGDVVFGALLVGVIGPAFVVWRASVTLLRSPADAQAGTPAELTVRAPTRLRVTPLDPPGPAQMVGPIRRRKAKPDSDSVTLIPAHRGVYTSIEVEVATAAPFGLQWWTYRIELPLAQPLHVAPRQGRPEVLPSVEDERDGGDGRAKMDVSGDLRTARPYRAGDRRSHVHWPITAHTGKLMVREFETPRGQPVTVTVVLPDDAEEAERAAERAFGTVARLLDRQIDIILATDEADGPVVALVPDRLQAGRRLARAVPK
jgi:uncharacterized protein (DUF58 family)